MSKLSACLRATKCTYSFSLKFEAFDESFLENLYVHSYVLQPFGMFAVSINKRAKENVSTKHLRIPNDSRFGICLSLFKIETLRENTCHEVKASLYFAIPMLGSFSCSIFHIRRNIFRSKFYSLPSRKFSKFSLARIVLKILSLFSKQFSVKFCIFYITLLSCDYIINSLILFEISNLLFCSDIPEVLYF